MTHPKEYSAAIVTVKHADQMTTRGRKAVAAWMRRQADFLEHHGQQFSSRFTARYLTHGH